MALRAARQRTRWSDLDTSEALACLAGVAPPPDNLARCARSDSVGPVANNCATPSATSPATPAEPTPGPPTTSTTAPSPAATTTPTPYASSPTPGSTRSGAADTTASPATPPNTGPSRHIHITRLDTGLFVPPPRQAAASPMTILSDNLVKILTIRKCGV
jgi:hypothetical protein